MKIAFCASEAFPFAKTGGLADSVGSLAAALAAAGHQVKVFIPWYKNIKPAEIYDDYGLTRENKVDFYFIRSEEYFGRDYYYGTPQGDYPDNFERFYFYSKRIFYLLKKLKFCPDIIHSHDWQAALVNVFLRTIYKADHFFSKTKSVLTIHNLAYQGIFDKEKFPILGLSENYFTMDYLEFYDSVNLLKGGIIFSDQVNTVSPSYAKQIQTIDYGYGLEGVLREKRGKLSGILNAVDYNVWNPKTDQYIYKKFTPRTIKDKAVNKQKLQKMSGLLVDKNKMLLVMVSRLAEQKGVDIFTMALDYILKKYQVIVLGVGDAAYHKILKKKAAKYRKSFSLNLKFDETLAHKIYAAGDCLLMPSRFEPCGIAQLIGYKYGVVPIVHNTGGLSDTVLDVESRGGGFIFNNYSWDALLSAVERAGDLFRLKPVWNKLVKKNMGYDFSWKLAGQKYQNLYQNIVLSRKL